MSASNKVVRFWNNVKSQTVEPYAFEGELIKAQELRKRCIERFNAERVRRGIPHE